MSKTTNSAAMESLVSRFHLSGQDQKSFAQSNGISKGKLHYWIKKLAAPSKTAPSGQSTNFIPLEVEQAPTARFIVIRCASGVEIEIPL
jgi:hypothetical protein